MKKTIGITGAGGRIGSVLSSHLIDVSTFLFFSFLYIPLYSFVFFHFLLFSFICFRSISCVCSRSRRKSLQRRA